MRTLEPANVASLPRLVEFLHAMLHELKRNVSVSLRRRLSINETVHVNKIGCPREERRIEVLDIRYT